MRNGRRVKLNYVAFSRRKWRQYKWQLLFTSLLKNAVRFAQDLSGKSPWQRIQHTHFTPAFMLQSTTRNDTSIFAFDLGTTALSVFVKS
jgi:hypothetical protein